MIRVKTVMADSQDSHSDLQLDKQVCFSLYSASNAMVRTYRPLLDKLDLTYLQYIVMMVLWEVKCVNVKTLGEKVHLDSGTLTPLLKRLEGKGLVLRRRSEIDERVREISLTEEGKALKQQAESVPGEMMCKAHMSIDELIELKKACDILLHNLSDNA
jgi:MarR family transcriptional regulator, organic hydroperoxide resistance regulator